MKIRPFLAAFAAVTLLGCTEHPTVPTGPRLLVCPSTTTLTGVFTADPLLGGSLTLGGTTVSIPPGAVSLPQLFVLTIPASKYMEIEVHADGLTSFLFNQPATISIDYSRCSDDKLAGKTLQAWYMDNVTDTLLENMNGTDDRAARKISFQTGHFSGYGVAW